jgi:hypothetical protein
MQKGQIPKQLPADARAFTGRDAELAALDVPAAPGYAAGGDRDYQLAPLAAEGARTLPLDPLGPEDSRALLARRLGPGRVAGEPAAAQQITDACAGLPLALVVVAGRAATGPAFPLAVLADELVETGRRLDVMTAGDALSDVRTAFFWSYQELPVLAAGRGGSSACTLART